MKSSDIRGWKDIYSFTLKQTLKSKAYQISFVIFILIALCGMPIYSYLNLGAEAKKGEESSIETVYVFNTTDVEKIDFSSVNENKEFSALAFVTAKEDYEIVSNRIETGELNSVLLNISYGSYGEIEIELLKAENSEIAGEELETLGTLVQSAFETSKITSLGLNDTQISLLQSQITSSVYTADLQGNEVVKEDTSITQSEYWFIYALLFIVMMVSIFSSSQIASSIISDKSSRVVEYLLTSVKPLAILLGKILAMLCAVLIQVLSMVIVLFVSNYISSYITGKQGNEILGQIISNEIIHNLNPINILVCLIVIALSFIFFATLAGLVGATVSKMQEASDSLTLFTIVTLVGVYMAIGAAGVMVEAGKNTFVYFALLFPISSAYILPGAILIGKASLGIAAIAIVLQLLFIYLLLRFTSKVYETLILHNGTRITLKKLFSISKAAKGGEKHE